MSRDAGPLGKVPVLTLAQVLDIRLISLDLFKTTKIRGVAEKNYCVERNI